ncbi:MAG: hypothetical protein ACLQCU_07225 [Acidimicrobiales bacterium]
MSRCQSDREGPCHRDGIRHRDRTGVCLQRGEDRGTSSDTGKVTLTLVFFTATLARPLRENETLSGTSSALPEVLFPSLAHAHRSWVSLREHFRKAHQREQPRIRGAVSAFRGAPDEPRSRHTS